MYLRLAELRARLAALDGIILRQQLLLDQLQTDKRAVQNELQSFAYPVLTLPPEITSEIFLHSLPDEPEPPHQMCAPLLLRRVCKAWEAISTSTPALWATLSLDGDRLQIDNSQRFQTIVKTWLDRAGSCPLTLIFRGQMGETSLDNACTGDIISFYAARLRRLDLRMDLEDFRVLKDIGSFPLLHDLTLGLPFQYDEDETLDDVLGPGVFEDTSVLRRLTLTENAVPSFATVSWQHLTIFHGEAATMQDCLNVLRFAPLLTECTFCVGYGTRDVHSGGGMLLHSRLQVLSLIESDKFDGTGDIFKRITLPSLHTLRISSVDDLNDDGSFQSFIHRSSPLLHTFSLSGFYLGPDDPFMPGCLRFMVKLTHLDLVLLDIDEGWMEELLRCLTNGAEDFLPELQHLVLEGWEYPVSCYTTMVQSLYSRWGPPVRDVIANLRSFKLTLQPNTYIDEATVNLDSLAELAAAGASIHIGTAEHNYFNS
ncbi:hypothetical protein B0H17DRAFT_1178135 [Mycena rosella]|uniref:F-box domain-containing protein n=1 Tax=Mycena rosella TaxID=1033263 RepID=A0AAD7DRN4_MYCRO|nr:hypothetical protein B0H17DRAFT_1178135 [Mycena rosella]